MAAHWDRETLQRTSSATLGRSRWPRASSYEETAHAACRAITGDFRPNLLIEAAGGDAFPEDHWVGSVLHIGGSQVRVDASDRRCVVVDVDPVTGRREHAALHAIIRERQGCLGVYGSIVQPGRIAIGDPVLIGGPRPPTRTGR